MFQDFIYKYLKLIFDVQLVYFCNIYLNGLFVRIGMNILEQDGMAHLEAIPNYSNCKFDAIQNPSSRSEQLVRSTRLFLS